MIRQRMRAGLLALAAGMALPLQVSGQVAPPSPQEQAAFAALERGRLDEAAAAFRQLAARDPRNARLHLGAGVAAFAQRRDAEAIPALTRALSLDPGLGAAREVLGQAYYRTGDLGAAIREYERLSAQPGAPSAAQATLERWRRELTLRDRMTVTPGDGFTLAFEGPPDAQVAGRAREALERALWRVGRVLSTFPLSPVPVVLYSAQQFRDVTRAPDWAAGAYDGVVRIPVRDALGNEAELERVLAHEFAHAVIRSLAPRDIPTWLNEGLATVLESDEPGRVESLPLKVSGPIFAALAGPFGRFDRDQAAAAYAVSARAARRLVDQAGGFAVANLLRDLGDGVPLEQAFEHRIQRPLSAFEAELIDGP